MKYRLKRQGLFFVAAFSIILFYLCCLFLPQYLLYVFCFILFIWSFISIPAGFLLLWPCLAPFGIVEIPSLPGLTLLPIFALWGLLFLMLHFAETLKDIKAVPRYAVIGICWILFAEVISGLVFSGGGNHIGMILVQITRTAQFLLALIFTIKVRNVKVVGAGYIMGSSALYPHLFFKQNMVRLQRSGGGPALD